MKYSFNSMICMPLNRGVIGGFIGIFTLTGPFGSKKYMTQDPITDTFDVIQSNGNPVTQGFTYWDIGERSQWGDIDLWKYWYNVSHTSIPPGSGAQWVWNGPSVLGNTMTFQFQIPPADLDAICGIQCPTTSPTIELPTSAPTECDCPTPEPTPFPTLAPTPAPTSGCSIVFCAYGVEEIFLEESQDGGSSYPTIIQSATWNKSISIAWYGVLTADTRFRFRVESGYVMVSLCSCCV